MGPDVPNAKFVAQVEFRKCVLSNENGTALRVAGACLVDASVIEHCRDGISAEEGAGLYAKGTTVQYADADGILAAGSVILEDVEIRDCGRRGVTSTAAVEERGSCEIQGDKPAPRHIPKNDDADEDIDGMLAAPLKRHGS